MVAILSVVGAVLSVVGIGVDWYYTSVLTDAGSQLEDLLLSIEVGSSFEDFVSNCWLFLLLGFFIFWIGLSIAFPKRGGSRE